MRSLEELRTRVISVHSRRYVDEAIAAYGAGAYRSAILALWIAVTTDLIEKIRLLAEQGEAAAVKSNHDLQRAIRSGDKATLQRFENGLLDTARKELHFIGEREYTELARLRDDRNLCAHPAYVSADGELFNPSPELVRAHLGAAVDCLLSHGPVTGRKAIERFEREIAGPSFPRDDNKLEEYLKATYFDRGSTSLQVNLVKAVSKSTLDGRLDAKLRWRYTRAILAMYRIAPSQSEELVRQLLDARQDGLDDDGLLRLVAGLCHLPFTWEALHVGVRNRVEQLLEDANIHDLLAEHNLFGPLPAAPVDDLLLRRLDDAVDVAANSKMHVELASPDPRLLPKLVQLLEGARSFLRADGVLRWINAIADVLSEEDVRRIVDVSLGNAQVYNSVLADRQLTILREVTTARLGTDEPWRDYDARYRELIATANRIEVGDKSENIRGS